MEEHDNLSHERGRGERGRKGMKESQAGRGGGSGSAEHEAGKKNQ
jgi:hypothetical protein